MTLSFTAHTISSDHTNHMAWWREGDWQVTWLRFRWLDRNQAITTMSVAETVGRSPDLSPGDREWPLLATWAAELGLTAQDTVQMAAPWMSGQESVR